MADERHHPTAYTVVSRERVHDSFFKVDKVVVSHERFDGQMSKAHTRLILERGDSAAALLFDPEQRMVILVDQFRVATAGKGRGDGWIVETAAGMVRADRSETPEQCIRREIGEETGYQVTDLAPVATFFSSPGGSSERIYLFCAEVRAAQQGGRGGGTDAGEDIRVVKLPLAEFMRKLSSGEFEDPKVIIAGQWLAQRQAGPGGAGGWPLMSWWRRRPGGG